MIVSRGFTLVEMMIGILLTSMVILGLAAVFSTVFQYEMAGYQKDQIQGGEVMSLDSLSRSVNATTMFSSPNPPCPSGNCAASSPGCPAGGPCGADILVGCTNLDGIPGATDAAAQIQLQNPSATATVYQYCVDANGNLLYSSESQSTPWTCGGAPCCPGAVACGNGIQGGPVTTVASMIGKDTVGGYANYFIRSADENNVVELHYVVGAGTAAVTVNSSVPASKPFGSLSP